ncbi:coiled-coil domain-containing protein 6 isoform X2 [Hyposmocoma kahamanoa]|uniref:coiled-coil domain-containing protein 6 isoform X2 n=1 Tax=Hyposmocoma kahamanoa TaxID=1477025 RepID=UPI000E6D5B21|nr:coiled-coil domain-containing protein 6 isoform X2 [Hyposmocoma kahamanoa]
MDDSVVSPGSKMADSASESDSSSLDGGAMLPPSTVSRDQLQKRIESLQQQNRVLKVELDTYKLRVKALQEENRALRQASVSIQAKAEQEEEYISNTLLKKIQALKKEKETLAHHYEREEECLTNDLSRKLNQLRQEKCRLEQTLEQEQECLVNKLMRKIEKLEAETLAKQTNLERLRREKVELENTLEQEQEALVNRLWKRMDKLEAEKRSLQIRLDQPISDPASPSNGDTASNLSNHIQTLRSEVVKLRNQLALSQNENKEKMQRFALEEKHIREENLRLQRKLQQEVERREALCRHLSESESSLEMEEERQFNEALSARSRSVSSPGGSRPLSPYGPPLLPGTGMPMSRPALHFNSQPRRPNERFVKPAVPGGAGLAARSAPLEPPLPPLLSALTPAANPAPPVAPPLLQPIVQPASPMDTSSKD